MWAIHRNAVVVLLPLRAIRVKIEQAACAFVRELRPRRWGPLRGVTNTLRARRGHFASACAASAGGLKKITFRSKYPLTAKVHPANLCAPTTLMKPHFSILTQCTARAPRRSVEANTRVTRKPSGKVQRQTIAVVMMPQRKGAHTHSLHAHTYSLGAHTYRLGASTQPSGAPTQPVGLHTFRVGSRTLPLGALTQAPGAHTYCLGAYTQPLGVRTQRVGVADNFVSNNQNNNH